jgi:hypothetical protein
MVTRNYPDTITGGRGRPGEIVGTVAQKIAASGLFPASRAILSEKPGAERRVSMAAFLLL